MEAHCITIKDYEPSVAQAADCYTSMVETGNDRWLNFNTHWATTPETYEEEYNSRSMSHRKLRNPGKASCGMSHYRLWEMAVSEPLIVLEHDAVFMLPATDKDIDMMMESHFGVISLYWPGGYAIYPPRTQHKGVVGCHKGVMAKAYLIKPHGAQALLDLVAREGMQQNDTFNFDQFPLQAGFYKNIVDDAVHLDKNLNTSEWGAK